MTQPETKTVLGRVFTRTSHWTSWMCPVKHGKLRLFWHELKQEHECVLEVEELEQGDDMWAEVASGKGPTESDAILALQSTLRKMAELEVVE